MDLEAMKIIIYITIMGYADNLEDLVQSAYLVTLQLSKMKTEEDLAAYMSTNYNLSLEEFLVHFSPEEITGAVNMAKALKDVGIL